MKPKVDDTTYDYDDVNLEEILEILKFREKEDVSKKVLKFNNNLKLDKFLTFSNRKIKSIIDLFVK